MSDDTRLLVIIEARLKQFENAIAKATGGADRAAKRIETRFRTMDRNLASVGGAFARSLVAPLAALVSAREIGQAIDSFTRIQNALRVVGLEGDAATEVFDKLFASAQKFGAPMEALVDVYRAGALAQKELNVSSEELINFTNGIAAALRVSGRSAGESRGALIQLAQAIGSGIVRAEEFNAILEGALPIAQAAARGLEEAGGSVAKLRKLVIDGKVSSEAFFRAFEAGQGTLEALAATTDLTIGQAFIRLQNTLIAAAGKFNETFGVSAALGSQFDILGRQIESLIGFFLSLAQPIEDIDSHFRSLINTINGAAEAVGRITGLGGVGTALGITSEEELRISRAAETADAMRTDLELAAKLREKAKGVGDLIAGPAVPTKTVSLRDFASPATTGGGRKKRSPSETFGQDIERIRERTRALEIETQAVGKSTLEAEKMLAVQDLINEAKRAGLAITPELTAKIEAEADAYAHAAATLEETEGKYRDIQEAQNFFAHTAFDSFSELIPIIETGNAALDRLLNTLIEAALQAALLGSGPLGFLLGGGSGGGKGLLGAVFGGARATGGPVSPGRAYVVGERGPEILMPSAAGNIRPMKSGAGRVGDMRISINLAGANGDAAIAFAAEAAARRGAKMAMSEFAEQQRAYA